MPTKRKKKSKAGRPRIKLCVKEVSKLAALGCTNPEIANFFGCSADTLERNFAGAIKAGRDKAHMSIRRGLFAHMRKGHAAVNIFLAKVQLGWRETVQLTSPAGEPVKVQGKLEFQDVTTLTPIERQRRLEELRQKALKGKQ